MHIIFIPFVNVRKTFEMLQWCVAADVASLKQYPQVLKE